ncbi:hypothetical protein VNO77_31269 [Canavalia gladiata]|uniref:Uncharacterized protein n=1 Tax=Canavalia gladiata TaxID=3824 RepID=A0AAN9KNT1_CANGL
MGEKRKKKNEERGEACRDEITWGPCMQRRKKRGEEEEVLGARRDFYFFLENWFFFGKKGLRSLEGGGGEGKSSLIGDGKNLKRDQHSSLRTGRCRNLQGEKLEVFLSQRVQNLGAL